MTVAEPFDRRSPFSLVDPAETGGHASGPDRGGTLPRRSSPALPDEVLRAAFEHSPSGMALVAADGRLLRVNRAFAALAGYATWDILTRSLPDLIADDGEDPLNLPGLRGGLATDPRPVRLERRFRRRGDRVFWGQLSVSLLMAGPESPAVFVAQLDDIDERRWLEEHLRQSALHDPLTGLPNRVLFEDRLVAAVARIGQSGEHLAVLFVDLDSFKRVNDRFGHEVGDAVLCTVG